MKKSLACCLSPALCYISWILHFYDISEEEVGIKKLILKVNMCKRLLKYFGTFLSDLC